MASPRPRTVVRLTAKTETGVMPSSTRSDSRVPTTATPPIVSGMAAATSEPKTKSSRMSVSGTAKASARNRSCSTTLLTSWKAAANPPTWTVDRARHVRDRGGDGRLAPGDLVLVAHDPTHDQRAGLVVGAQHRDGVEAPVGLDVRHVGLRGQEPGERASGRGDVGAVHRSVPRVDEEDEVVRSGVEPRRQHVGRLDRLLRGGVEPALGEAGGHVARRRGPRSRRRGQIATRMATRCATTPRARRRRHRSTRVRWPSPRAGFRLSPGPLLPPYRRYLLTVCSIRTVSRSVKETP